MEAFFAELFLAERFLIDNFLAEADLAGDTLRAGAFRVLRVVTIGGLRKGNQNTRTGRNSDHFFEGYKI